MNGKPERRENLPAGRHESYWLDTAERPWFPSVGEAVHADVVVIGGGITGITSALFLKRAGLKVVILEAGRIVSGVTAYTTAKITSLHTLIYRHLVSAFGEEKAKQYAEAGEWAIGTIGNLVKEYSIECDYEELPFFTFADTEKMRPEVEKEAEAARKLGLPASFVENPETPEKCYGAVRFDGQAQFHPVKYLSRLVREIPGGGCHVFENSRAVDITEGDICQVSTKNGSVNAPFVVVATHYPIHDKQGFYFARLHQERHYAAAVRIPGRFPNGMFIGASENGYAYRAVRTGEGDVVIVTGGHHKAGQGGDTYAFYRDLESTIGEVLPGGEILNSWSTQATFSVDRVPYIGKLHSGNDRVFTATGFGAWGMTTGTAAARIITDLISGNANPWADVFDPSRFKPGTSAKEFLSQNLNVGKEFVKGRLGIKKDRVRDVRPGQGKIVSEHGEKIGVYCDESGGLHAVHPVCTHMGCSLNWNPAEKSWDCPCHGSRFSFDGDILHAPALSGLPRVELSEGDSED